MGQRRLLRGDFSFGLGAHRLRLLLDLEGLDLELEATGTCERWRGRFDAAYIEELTRRTGNFKEFGVFCSMLEAAVTQRSASVRLELLSFSDLESLRSRRAGSPPRRPPPPGPLRARRYLILVYCTEFDRIHYPLPLPHVGRASPASRRAPSCDASCPRDLRLLDEELEAQEPLQEEPGGGKMAEASRTKMEARGGKGKETEARGAKASEASRLRRALQEARQQLRGERERHQRQLRELQEQLAAAQDSQRRLQRRVELLTIQLCGCKSGAPQRSNSGSHERQRRSPSPAASRPPRFDPTAFVRARQQRQQELELRRRRRGRDSGSTSPATSRGRSSSARSFRSLRSSSLSDSEEPPKTHQPLRGRGVTRSSRALSASSCNRKTPSSTLKPPPQRPGKENLPEEPLAEIDARLRALQLLLDSLGPQT
ncbi:centrosomal protein CCDC61 [Phaenicophaeus curvirostris]|uniref:centrosomal protein CCDC61 n=1 Tax=Phaenicophaeus curvirostris TaxID=33595 RepID=UPI0037F09847